MEYPVNDLEKLITDSVIRKIDGRRTGAGSHSRYLIYSILARQCSSEQSLLSLDHMSVLRDQDFLDFIQGPLNSNLVLVDPKPITESRPEASARPAGTILTLDSVLSHLRRDFPKIHVQLQPL